MDLPKKSKGLGSSANSGLNSPLDPPSFGPKRPIDDSAPSWAQLRLQVTGDQAAEWLGLRPSETMAVVLEAIEVATDNQEKAKGKSPKDLPEANSLQSSFDSFGSPVNLEESVLARDALEFLEDRLDVSFRHGVVQLNSSLFVNLNELGDDSASTESIENIIHSSGQVELEEGGSNNQTWMAPFGSAFGTRVLVNMRAFKNKSGVESLAFFVHGVIASRPAPESPAASLKSEVNYLDNQVLPELAKRLLYLAETPFPSNSLTMFSRDIAYPNLEEAALPVPFYSHSNFSLVNTAFEEPGGNSAVHFHIFPQVVTLGYRLFEINRETCEPVISRVVDSLVKIASILEDGFRNYSQEDEVFGWPELFGSHASKFPIERAQQPRWIPSTHMGDLVYQTSEMQKPAHRQRDETTLKWLAEFGAGSQVSDAINTLAFSILMPRRSFEEAEGYLKVAVALEHYGQSTNALCNLGQVYLGMGDGELAEKTLLQALDRADSYSEGEASLFLGKIYKSRGDELLAQKYLKRAAESGDDAYAARAKAIMGGAEDIQALGEEQAETQVGPRAKFCGGCGQRFDEETQKFCGVCGEKRG